MNVLAGKVVIVTGASSGIGRATALLFAREGARLIVTARRQSQLDELVIEIGKAGGGSLIFTSSFVGYTVGMPGMAAYAASKAGLIGLTQVLAAEFGAKGVRVNAILPGGTDTPASITNAPDATPDVLAFVESLHALKRMAKPEEIARSVLHLASDASSFITGTALLVDGGVSISRS